MLAIVIALAVVLPFVPVALLALFAGRFVARRLRRQLPPAPPRVAPDSAGPVDEDEMAPVS